MKLYEVLYVDFKALWEVINGYDLVSRPVHSTALPSLRVRKADFIGFFKSVNLGLYCKIPNPTQIPHVFVGLHTVNSHISVFLCFLTHHSSMNLFD